MSVSVLKITVALYHQIWREPEKTAENYLKIEKKLTQLLKQNPNDTRALTNLGATLCNKGKHEIALQKLLKAERLGSVDANLYQNIGIAKMNIEVERENAKAYFNIANTLNADELTFEAYFDPHGY